MADEAAKLLVETMQFTEEPSKRNAAATAHFVDLSSFLNASLAENRGMGEFNLAALPQGRQKFAEIEFEVGPGIVQLASQATERFARRFPTNVTGIKVGRKCRVLHFLYGSERTDRDQFVARYVIHFSNGRTWEIPVSGQDVNAFRSDDVEPHKAKRALLVHVVPQKRGAVAARLLQTSWENPLPNLEIESIDYISAMNWGSAYLVAITVE